MTTDLLLSGLGFDDLAAKAAQREPFGRADLARVVAAGNPLAAASLADIGRAAGSGVEVTHPWTLRVRAPGIVHGLEDATKVAHDLASDLSGIEATEIEMLGAFPADGPLALALELTRSLHAARHDLTLRAFTAREVAAIAALERKPAKDVVDALFAAGLSTLSWRPGCGRTADDIDLHRAAQSAGLATVATIGYSRVDDAFLDRLGAWSELAGETGKCLAALVLPHLTDGASPLDGTSGTEDWMACALTRLAFGRRAARVSVDWHVVGHKLGATMLSCGADDVVGAQAAAAWAPPTDDGPRPLNPDRARRWIVEARRSPVRRDALFRRVGK